MKKLSILLIIITLQLSSCKQKELSYQYSDKEGLINCSYGDMELVKEAVYAFEDYITKNYAFLGNTTSEGYHNYLELLFNNRPPATEYFSEHIKEVAKVLKADDDLYIINGSKTRLNYEHELVNCILNNIKDENVKNTIIVLIESNTLSAEVLAPVLFRKRLTMAKEDRALATYVALDMFYTKLIHMSSPDYVEKVNEIKPTLDEIDPKNPIRAKNQNALKITKDSLELTKKKTNNE